MSTLSRLTEKANNSFMGDYSALSNDVNKIDKPQFSDLYGIEHGLIGLVANQLPPTIVNGGDKMINGNLIVKGSVTASKLTVGEQSFVSTVAFTTSYADECSWSSGIIRAMLGNDITINSGTTGRLQAILSAWTVDANTLALWHMDETSGTAVDNIQGTAALDGTATNATANASGKFSYCRAFNGTTAYVQIADSAALDTVPFTWEGWFKTSSTVAANQYLISRSYTGASATDRYFDLFVNALGFLQANVYGYTGTSYVVYTVISFARMDDSAWHSFAVSFNDTTDTLVLYIDGIQHDIKTNCTYNPRASAQVVNWGKSDLATPGYFSGNLDEFRFSNSARTYSPANQLFIYYDADYGATLQTTSIRANSIGDNRILLCIVTPQIGGSGAQIELMRKEGTTITGDSITTGRIQSADHKTYFDLDDRRIIINDEQGFDRVLLGRF